MKNKWLSIFCMVLFMTGAAFSTFAGGTQEEAASADGELPLYTIKWLDSTNTPVSNSLDTPIGQIIKDKFNIIFESDPYTGDWRERTNLMLAAGDYPEILRIQYDDIVMNYINAGAALPLDDLIEEYGPNFKERHESAFPYWRLPAEDGKLYKWENAHFGRAFSLGSDLDMAVRSDALEAMEWPKLLSEDSWLDYLEAALEKFPTTNGEKTLGIVVPFAEPWGLAGLASIMFEKAGYNNLAGNGGVIFDIENDEFMHYLLNPYVKESHYFFNKAYKRGILDPECFTDYLPQVTEKVNSGRALSIYYCTWLVDGANAGLRTSMKSNMEYVKLPIRLNSQMKEGLDRPFEYQQLRPFDSTIMTDKARYPERIMQYLDWASTEEGHIMLGWGIEGTHYNVVDGKRTPTQEFLDGFASDPDYINKLGLGFAWVLRQVGAMTGDIDPTGQPYKVEDFMVKSTAGYSKRENEWLTAFNWTSKEDTTLDKEYYPWEKTAYANPEAIAVTLPSGSEESKIEQKLIDHRVRSIPQLIMAKDDAEFEKIWNRVIEEYWAMDPQRVIDKYNEIYKGIQAKIDALNN